MVKTIEGVERKTFEEIFIAHFTRGADETKLKKPDCKIMYIIFKPNNVIISFLDGEDLTKVLYTKSSGVACLDGAAPRILRRKKEGLKLLSETIHEVILDKEFKNLFIYFKGGLWTERKMLVKRILKKTEVAVYAFCDIPAVPFGGCRAKKRIRSRKKLKSKKNAK